MVFGEEEGVLDGVINTVLDFNFLLIEGVVVVGEAPV